METTIKEAPTKLKTAKSSSKPSFSAEDVEKAIKVAFPGIKGTMSVRFLWESESVHRFRVNWWGIASINDSKFLRVAKEKGKIKVEER